MVGKRALPFVLLTSHVLYIKLPPTNNFSCDRFLYSLRSVSIFMSIHMPAGPTRSPTEHSEEL